MQLQETCSSSIDKVHTANVSTIPVFPARTPCGDATELCPTSENLNSNGSSDGQSNEPRGPRILGLRSSYPPAEYCLGQYSCTLPLRWTGQPYRHWLTLISDLYDYDPLLGICNHLCHVIHCCVINLTTPIFLKKKEREEKRRNDYDRHRKRQESLGITQRGI